MSPPGTIVHMVLTHWRGDVPSEALDDMRRLIGRFADEIPGVVSVDSGASVSTEGLEGEFEWGLVVSFRDASARDAYLHHPVHVPVAALIGKWAERVVVFDVAA